MSFVPLYKLRRSVPAADEKLLILDRKGKTYLQVDSNGKLSIPQAGNFPELLSVELYITI